MPRATLILLLLRLAPDGSHIKGLVINFFRHFWPKLLKPPIDQPPQDFSDNNPSFLSSFITPLLKATRKGKKEVISFFNMADYQAWRDTLEDADEIKKWAVKFYKGLGTSTHAEAKEYFAAFDEHLRPFSWKSDADGELLDMVFDKKRAGDRKTWILEEYDEGHSVIVDPACGNIVTYEDFINKELIHFSNADNIRSIPSAIDGLKPSQRKVLYACFKRKLKSEIKVAQLTGYCAEHTAYHHGEASLQSTSKLAKGCMWLF
jgi:DNA topoisomerase-2